MSIPLTLATGSANVPLAQAVSERVGVRLAATSIHRFPDGELHVAVRDSLRGHDVYLFQPTSPPFETHFLELVLLTDAARRAGAARLTAVIPYFGYARQDRRAGGREPVGARVIADLLIAGGIHRIVAVDLHSPALEGFFAVPLEHLTVIPSLAEAVPGDAKPQVVVAPDLGAARLADRYARVLDLPVAMVHKTRVSGEEVVARGVTGDVRDRAPVIIDDMISTGATIEAAAAALVGAGCLPDITVVATHALLVGGAAERLRGLQLRRLVVTDTVSLPPAAQLPLQVVSLAPLLADSIKRLHEDRSLADLLVHG